ncbi:MAG: hypothetical protein GX262_11570 [Clostridia bacterium]|nr:hypothetical protein [Clostridia bacterium]
MEGQLAKDVFQQIYDTLNSVNHVPYDCGNLCDKACCQRIDADMGIYLLPNEHLVLQGETGWLTWEEHLAQNYDFPASWQGNTYFLHCNGNCPREKRPIQCRTFPLTPHLSSGGDLMLIWETLELPYSCPLLNKREALDKDFIKALFNAWQTLVNDPLIRDLVDYDSRNREAERAIVEVIYR